MIDNTQMPFGEVSTVSKKFESFRAQHFRFLMENLCVLEETFVDSEALRLEKAIILQLGKLGALELFNVCLSRSLGTSLVSNYADKVDDYKDKVVVQSSKKKENKTRRKREFVSTAVSSQSLTLKANQEDLLGFSASLVKRAPNTKNKRILVAKREAEMSKGVKVSALPRKYGILYHFCKLQKHLNSVICTTLGASRVRENEDSYRRGYQASSKLEYLGRSIRS